MSLRKFDLFTKIDNEYRIGTTMGGILSIISIFTVILLSGIEIFTFYHPPIRQRLTVDSARPTEDDGITITMESQPRIDIFLNITFPHVPCYLLSFDVIDPITQFPIPLDTVNITRFRLSKSDKNMNHQVKGKLPDDYMNSEISKTPGSCYVDDHSKCSSCQEVFEVYRKRRFQPPPLKRIDQCRPVVQRLEKMREEGCRIESDFRAVRVGGEFIVSPGISWYNEGIFLHNLMTFDIALGELNLSHKINALHFFSQIGGVKTKNRYHNTIKMPLDGFMNVQDETNAVWRVVYTSDILDNNFSVSRFAVYSPTNKEPGIVFKYDISPIMATAYLDQEPIFHLATRLLTVLGGALGIFRLIDGALFMSKKKNGQNTIAEEK